jgi:hypothetical protein
MGERDARRGVTTSTAIELAASWLAQVDEECALTWSPPGEVPSPREGF